MQLKLSGDIVNVGTKWYLEADFPDIAPDLSVVYKTIKARPETGVSLYSLIEMTGLSEALISGELKFLMAQRLIYPNDSRYFAYFTPDPFEPHELKDYVDFLTRNELVALVKLFIQQTKWAYESIEAAQKLINSRTFPIPVEIPRLRKPTVEDLIKQNESFLIDPLKPIEDKQEFTKAGGQFAGIEPDGSINLDFGNFSG